MFRSALLILMLAGGAAAQSLADDYREPAARLIGAALADDDGWKKLEHLSYRIGHRLSGSEALSEAIRWAAGLMRLEGLENVQTPAVKVPHWVRGQESAEMVAPVKAKLAMLGLGNSVGTPAEGITAEVVAVTSFEDLAGRKPETIKGKIVLYDVPWLGYGRTVQYRGAGASRAAAMGAVAALVRSAGPDSFRLPHTGALNYAAGVEKIPAAALASEDVYRLRRLLQNGERVVVQLKMEARMLPEADSANVVAELVGREKPEEVVVLGGHLDSWDVGQGAQDDGSGCVAAWQAVTLMKRLGLRPRRTVRVVLWTNEENGLAGGRAYREWIGEAIRNHVAAIEMDGGSEAPAGFGLGMTKGTPEQKAAAMAKAREIGALLAGLNAGEMREGGGGADIGPLTREGVPGFGHLTRGGRYFEWHHTEADTLDKIDARDFRMNTAALAVLAYVLADMREPLVK